MNLGWKNIVLPAGPKPRSRGDEPESPVDTGGGFIKTPLTRG